MKLYLKIFIISLFFLLPSDSFAQLSCGYSTITNPDGSTSVISDPSGYSTGTVGLSVTNIQSCPLPGRKIENGELIGNEYLISGVVCVIQSILAESMMRVYCNIIAAWTPIVQTMIIIYIIIYGLVIMLGIGNENLSKSMVRVIKIVIVYTLATNATEGFKWIHQNFTGFMETFTSIMVEELPIQTKEGNNVYSDDGIKILDVNGNPYVATANPYIEPRRPKQRLDQTIAPNGDFRIVYSDECAVWDQMALPGTICLKRQTALTGRPTLSADFLYHITLDNNGLDSYTTQAPPRKPIDGIFYKIDAIMAGIAGKDEIHGINGLISAFILWGVGGGFLLSLFLATGITALAGAFLTLMTTYLSALMALMLLMMVSPIFISFALFEPTKPLFAGWLSACINYMIQPIVILGFLLILGEATKLDQLYKLMTEVETREYNFGTGKDALAKFKAPGFTPPSYINPKKLKAGQDALATPEEQLAPDAFFDDMGGAQWRREQFKKAVDEAIFKEALVVSGVANITYEQFVNEDPLYVAQAPLMTEINQIKNSYYELKCTTPGSPSAECQRDLFLTITNDKKLPLSDEAIEEKIINNPDLVTNNIKGYFETEYNNNIKKKPVCRKNCPEDASGNVTHDPALCVKHCMYLYESQDEKWLFVLSAIMPWLILNMMAGAIISIVPQISSSLSRFTFEGMGSSAPAMSDGDKFSSLKSFASLDGVINDKKPSVLVAAADKLYRTVEGPKMEVQQDGTEREVPRQPLASFMKNYKGAFGNPLSQDQTDIRAKADEAVSLAVASTTRVGTIQNDQLSQIALAIAVNNPELTVEEIVQIIEQMDQRAKQSTEQNLESPKMKELVEMAQQMSKNFEK
jgi:type IV secretory pathway VirB6-like protein